MNRFLPQPPFQIFGQRAGASIARAWILLQALHADRFKLRIDPRMDCTRAFRFLLGDEPQRLEDGGRLKRGVSGEYFVENCADTVDVRSDGHAFAGRLLRRHVAGRAEWSARHGERRSRRLFGVELKHFRETEIGQVRLSLAVHQNIGRLEVAVQDTVLVSVVNGPCHDRDESRDGDGALAQFGFARGAGARALPARNTRNGDVWPLGAATGDRSRSEASWRDWFDSR